MNVTASKVLLALSVAAYTYCSWDHIVPSKKPEAVASKPVTLTAAIVNHVEALSLGRDVFESIQIDRGVGEVNALPGDDAADPTTAGAAPRPAGAAASPGGDAPAAASMFSLQGVFMAPDGHTALINGTPVDEGEVATIGVGGPKILATKIGEDYAIIVSAGKTIVLKLSDPSLKSAGTSSDSNSNNVSSGSSPNSPPPPGTSRNGYSDPYAGHRTGHH